MGTNFSELLAKHVSTLRRMRGLFSGREVPSVGEWEAGVRSLSLPAELQGLDGLFHVASLRSSELDSFRVRFLPQLAPLPPTQREPHWIVLHASAAPYTGARGLDLGTVPRLTQTLERACDQGEEVFTARDQSFGCARDRAVTLCFLPIYRTEALPTTVEERRSELRGWAGAVLHVPTLLAAAAIGAEAADLDACVLDDASAPFRDGVGTGEDAWGPGPEDPGPFDLPVRGTSWKLQVWDRPATSKSSRLAISLVSIGIVLGVAALLFLRVRGARPLRGPAPPRMDDAAPTSPLRILLVEDQPMNRELTRRLLAAEGHVVDEAVDGHEALEWAGRARYDIVLLDLQMPGMDGFETARELRRLEGGSAARTPIIALTARVLEDGDQSCRESGMDDYLRKPFQPQEMKAMLHKWVPTGSVPPEGRPAPASPLGASGNRRPQDQNLLDRLDELGVLKDPALTQRLTRVFLDDSTQVLADLRGAIARNDGAAAARLGHRLLSASLSIGASTLAGMARRMEQQGETQPPEQAAALLGEMQTELEAVRAFVRTLPGGA
jgi:CheY-like chemotaxis protein/HPt (histidine-containing phosphotransfer) domain-containing protein